MVGHVREVVDKVGKVFSFISMSRGWNCLPLCECSHYGISPSWTLSPAWIEEITENIGRPMLQMDGDD